MKASSPAPWGAAPTAHGTSSIAQRAARALALAQQAQQATLLAQQAQLAGRHAVTPEARAALHASRIAHAQQAASASNAAHAHAQLAQGGFQQPAPPQHPHPGFAGGYPGAASQQVLQAQQSLQSQQVFHKARPSQPPQQSQASNGVDIAAALRDQLLTRPDLIQALESTAHLPGDASASSQPVAASDDTDDLAAALRAQLLDRPELIHALEASAAMPQQEESVADNAAADDGDEEAIAGDGAAQDSGASGSDKPEDTSLGVKLETNAEEASEGDAKPASGDDANADAQESAPEKAAAVADGEAGSSPGDVGGDKEVAEASVDDNKNSSPKMAPDEAEQPDAEAVEQSEQPEGQPGSGSAPQDGSMSDGAGAHATVDGDDAVAASEDAVAEGSHGNDPSNAGNPRDAEQESSALAPFPEVAEVAGGPSNAPDAANASPQLSVSALASTVSLASVTAAAASPGPSATDATVRGQPSASEELALDRTLPQAIQFSKEALEAAGLAARSAHGPPEAVVEAAARAALEVMINTGNQQSLQDLPVTVVAAALSASARGESFQYVPADYDEPAPQTSPQAPLQSAPGSDGLPGAAASVDIGGEEGKRLQAHGVDAPGGACGASGTAEMPDPFGHFDMALRYGVPSGDAGPDALFFRYDVSPDDNANAVFANLRRRCEIELDDGCIVQMTMQVIRQPG